ncbi:MAG: OB-fold nucleic acid binding domain-containing protein [Candidatus Omnitrophica bacterium]|nr:OB-fold nucleic acid binding domain-containing protein [Candidatus Omnitrophota bacterium]
MAHDAVLEGLVLNIAKARGIADDAVRELVKKKQEEFSGLLTARGAAQLLAQDAGLENPGENDDDDASEVVPLADAEEQSDVFVRVKAVFSPKSFEKNARKGRVCNITITDGKTDASLVLWNRDVDLVEYGKIERNDYLLLKNAQVRSTEPLELHSSMLTKVIVKKPDALPVNLIGPAAAIPANPVPVRKVSELSETDPEFDLFARVLRVEDEKEFVYKDGRKGRVGKLLVSDGTGTVRVVLWDKNADVVQRAKVGDALKIEGGYAKKSFSGDSLEINVGWKGRAFLNPAKHPLGEKDAVLSKMYKEKPLSEANEGDEFISWGTITSIDSAIVVKKCKTCKTTIKGGASSCEKCGGPSSTARDLLVVAVTLNDGTKNVRATFFDSQAKELLDVHETTVDIDTVVRLKREYLIDKKVRGVFAAKTNSFSGNLEVTARHVISVK